MSPIVVDNAKVVSISYVLYNEQGDIFEVRDLPIAYVHGAGSELFPRIERALAGHGVGDQVEVVLPPEDGFGAHDPGLTFTDNIENVPSEFRRIGAEVEMQNEKGEGRVFHVTRIEDGRLTVDGNHRLAGQTTRFVVTIQAVRKASVEEVRRGMPAIAESGPLIQ